MISVFTTNVLICTRPRFDSCNLNFWKFWQGLIFFKNFDKIKNNFLSHKVAHVLQYSNKTPKLVTCYVLFHGPWKTKWFNPKLGKYLNFNILINVNIYRYICTMFTIICTFQNISKPSKSMGINALQKSYVLIKIKVN